MPRSFLTDPTLILLHRCEGLTLTDRLRIVGHVLDVHCREYASPVENPSESAPKNRPET